ncbi:uncharacterized protein LOC101719920 isoform X2 [Heterocephalus glaber]|uniref:Uncharacterized protein LOC101719920 isoform X2 n=1 Tax=Heterocephalus glaber TaxID=10181 RepID=A0AAX6RQN3_HETGA|nr:uncharacterized protein LOC101719920 isoform X2 [Heterocephalus glaber]XP_021099611.1 uncharacterized protein LOC101719920 isoform X2 [Heterocephalus glaber]
MSPFALLMRNTTTNRPAEHKLPWVTHVGAEGQQYCLGKALKDILFPGGERNKAWAVSVSSSLSQGPRMNLMGNLLDLTLQILPTLLLGCNLDEWKRQISPDKGGDQVRQQGNYPHQTLCCEFKMVGCSAFLIAEVLWGRGVACLHWCFIATTCGPELWDIPVLSAFQPCQDLASVFHEKSSVLFT